MRQMLLRNLTRVMKTCTLYDDKGTEIWECLYNSYVEKGNTLLHFSSFRHVYLRHIHLTYRETVTYPGQVTDIWISG